MPAVLTDTFLCDPFVPAAWAGVLADLQAFTALRGRLRQAKGVAETPADLAQIVELHARLVEGSAALLEPQSLADLGAGELAHLFARALLFAVRMKLAIVADGNVLDTAGSRTLGLYEADFYGTRAKVDDLRDRLLRNLAIPASALAGIEAEVERDLDDARRKQAIVRALRDEFGLWPGNPELRQSVHRCFLALHPDAPLPPEEVEVVITATTIFFCLPFEGQELTTPRFRALPPAEQRPVQEFLGRIQRFAQQRFGNFPAFGFLNAALLSPALVDRVAGRAALSQNLVADEIGRLVTILPLHHIDKYLVHDVWGHGWQASLLRFEQMYQAMAGYDDPLRLDEHCPSAGGVQRLTDCFQGAGENLRLDESRFVQFLHGELAERLSVALSAVLAEMMADVAEFKLLAENAGRADLLPSSSLLPIFPAKLDLTLDDIPFYFGQATKTFRQWARSPERKQSMAADLVRRGAAPAAAEAAVARAAAIWQALAESHYAPRLACEPAAGGCLRVNAFTRIALNFLGIHRAILRTYERLEDLQPVMPLKSYKDLLVIGASVFFEADRPRNLWRVDEFLTLHFLPLCRQFAASDPQPPN